MHKSHLITGLWLVAVQSLKVQPVTETVKSTSTPIASGGSSATLIPFNVDVVGPPDHRMDESIGNFYTSVWESKVSVHETSDSIQSFVSLKWPDGQGPGAAPISANKTWNACVLAMPDLREIVGAPGPGDGSCYDLVYPACLESMASLVSRTFLAYLGSSKPITPESVAYACKSVVDITMLPPLCVKSPPPPKPHDSDDSDDSDQLTTIKAYPFTNFTNGQPFLIGVDDYKSGKGNKADIRAKAIARTWALLIVEAEGYLFNDYSMTCPSAELGSSSDASDAHGSSSTSASAPSSSHTFSASQPSSSTSNAMQKALYPGVYGLLFTFALLL